MILKLNEVNPALAVAYAIANPQLAARIAWAFPDKALAIAEKFRTQTVEIARNCPDAVKIELVKFGHPYALEIARSRPELCLEIVAAKQESCGSDGITNWIDKFAEACPTRAVDLAAKYPEYQDRIAKAALSAFALEDEPEAPPSSG